jgi:hypothetical protein
MNFFEDENVFGEEATEEKEILFAERLDALFEKIKNSGSSPDYLCISPLMKNRIDYLAVGKRYPQKKKRSQRRMEVYARKYKN